MVLVQKNASRKRTLRRFLPHCIIFIVISLLFTLIVTFPDEENTKQQSASLRTQQQSSQHHLPCPYTELSDLNPSERHPTKGTRHMVDPPSDTHVTLVCCHTTAGPWNILVHHSWAPLGADRFVNMVQTGYFQPQTVPLMRCIHNFLCQFGLAGNKSKLFGERLEDDPNWLPEGPQHRQNENGVKRFAVGYLAYAGAGPRSRTNQLIVALKDNPRLAGGSPWEVPWGEVVGRHSFETLAKIYTGYGEKGPKQGRLHKEDYREYVKENFPELDWIRSCAVVDEEIGVESSVSDEYE